MVTKKESIDELQNEVIIRNQSNFCVNDEDKIPIEELFPEKFMSKYTSYSGINELLEDNSDHINRSSKIRLISNEEFEDTISKNTVFDSWTEMLEKAGNEWIARKFKSQY